MRNAEEPSVASKALLGRERFGVSAGDDELTIDDLNHVVAQIGRLTRTASVEFALRVGALIIHHFYGGNVDKWRLRGPKTTSFRRLAEHPGLPMSAGMLYRCVAIFELCERLDAPSRWQNLGASHLRLVLQVKPEIQEGLLVAANSERWTVRALQQRVTENNLARRGRGGRRPQSRTAKFIGTISKCLVDHRELLDSDGPADRSELHELERVLSDARMALEKVRRALLNADCNTSSREEAEREAPPAPQEKL